MGACGTSRALQFDFFHTNTRILHRKTPRALKRAGRAPPHRPRSLPYLTRTARAPPPHAHRITADSTPRRDPHRLHPLAPKTARISPLARNARRLPAHAQPTSPCRPLQSVLACARASVLGCTRLFLARASASVVFSARRFRSRRGNGRGLGGKGGVGPEVR